MEIIWFLLGLFDRTRRHQHARGNATDRQPTVALFQQQIKPQNRSRSLRADRSRARQARENGILRRY
jgi:hypothetical protein